MGVSASDKIIHSAKDLPIQTVTIFLSTNRRLLLADVDISWAVFKAANRKDDSVALVQIGNLLATLANCGFHVTPICDGVERHRSKRASMQRIQKSELKRMSCMASRFEASRLSQQLTSESNVEDTKKLQLELVLKNKEIRSFENGSTIRVSSDFGSKLQVYLSDNDFYDPNRFVGSIKKVFISKFQADSVIGKRAQDKKKFDYLRE